MLLTLAGAAATAILLPLLATLLRPRLMRRNFEGFPVLAAAGLAPALATALVALAAPRIPLLAPFLPTRLAIALAVAALLFALLGLADDLWGARDVGGLRGHLRCLTRERRVTTGLVKAAGGAVAGLLIGVWLSMNDEPSKETEALLVVRRWSSVLLTGAWIALSANAVNLLDLRPLRAAKGTALLALLVVGAALLGGGDERRLAPLMLLAGAMAPYLPLEARCRVMLGDAGANFLGAAVAVVGAWACPSPAPIVLLTALLLLLHAWTEHHSLSAAIAARPWLARLDAWGWQRPPESREAS
jgi:UDP-N-acetylmuramyl pentapeptide phosphotransferase/UDP-N-acetylglucosamine-1-phosphate transferase